MCAKSHYMLNNFSVDRKQALTVLGKAHPQM
jgi:hypothetical protein